MEEKAKRVGKFNIVDIIAVILIVAVVAFVGWKLLSRGSVEAGETAYVQRHLHGEGGRCAGGAV